MRAVIIGNGEIGDPRGYEGLLRTEDMVICADGGAVNAEAMGIRPHVLIGDLDSFRESRIRPEDVEVSIHPMSKDATDLELAIDYALEQGADEILLLGAVGSRLDQTLANVGLLSRPLLEKVPTRLLGPDWEAFLIWSEGTVEGELGEVVSLIPMTPEVAGITTEGLEYPLRRGRLRTGYTVGISNTLTAPQARIEIKTGLLLVVHLRGTPD